MLRPDLPFLFGHPFHFLACGLGSGLSPFAPGTVGTLAAWALYPLVRSWFGDTAFLLFLALAFAVGVPACDRTGRSLGVADHGAIVWDEMVPFWAVLFFTPPTPAWQALAFLLFRGFDILKPPPADWIDAHLKNGLGVMLDDVVAGLYTLVALAVIKAVID